MHGSNYYSHYMINTLWTYCIYYTKPHTWRLDAIAFRRNNSTGRKDNHLVHEATVADCSSATETISTMTTSSNLPTQSGGDSGSTPPLAGANTRMNSAYNTTFGMPSGIKLNQFDGSDWSNWSGMLE